MGDVVPGTEVWRNSVGQQRQVSDLGDAGVGIADAQRHLRLLAPCRRAHIEDHLIVAVGEYATFAWTRPGNCPVELEHVVPSCWSRNLSRDGPFLPVCRHNATGDSGGLVQVVAHVEPIPLVT